MKYVQPEAAALASGLKIIEAALAIKQPRVVLDTNTLSPYMSSGAYEADE